MSSPFNLGVQRVSASPYWRTPSRLFAELDAEFHFTLDPAASEPIKDDIEWFSESDQGLWQRWSGRVFLNPPYGRAIADWMQKVQVERENCDVIVCLVPSRTDSRWWHDVAMTADEVRFLRGRLRFEGGPATTGHNAPFPSAVLVFQRRFGTPVAEVGTGLLTHPIKDGTFSDRPAPLSSKSGGSGGEAR